MFQRLRWRHWLWARVPHVGPPFGGLRRVIVRPSGTEPKIKFYIEAKLPLEDANDFDKVHEKVQNRLRDLTEAILDIVA